MLNRARAFEKGDTLIEVLVAVAVFSLVVVGALALMNQGSATSQRSLEITLVSQEIDNQAEVLRFLHEAYVKSYQPGYSTTTELEVDGAAGEFYDIVQLIRASGSPVSASPFGNLTTCQAPRPGSFALNTRTATVLSGASAFQTPTTYAKINYATSPAASQGIWIEGIRSPLSSDPTTSRAGFIDFHIRACWDAPGLSVPSTFGTIVRLYEPRG